MAIPEKGVGMKICRWIEPKRVALFPVSGAVDIDIGLDKVGFAGDIAQELEV